jgi:uncharacterized protein YbjT (DUF2867 family)
MKAILFGATGMVGQGVLRECLLDPAITSLLVIARSPTGQRHEKLRELVQDDVSDLSAVAGELAGYDTCFFCLGVSSVGMSEADYTRVTYELTMKVARVLVERSPGMTFLFISGASTDATEQGRTMWARVKGKTENALRALPFKAAFMLRPAFIQPRHGIVSKTRFLRLLYAVLGPLYPLWRLVFPGYVTTTETLGRAMILIAKQGAPRPVLENRDINAVVAAAGGG